jgi:hypothetical protein
LRCDGRDPDTDDHVRAAEAAWTCTPGPGLSGVPLRIVTRWARRPSSPGSWAPPGRSRRRRGKALSPPFSL